MNRGMRLPLHPRPLPHEALSSWIGRLAAAYGLQPNSFLRSAFGADPSPSAAELDSIRRPDLVVALAERTGVPHSQLRAMTLAGYMPELVDALEPSPGLFENYACRFGWHMPAALRSGARPESFEEWVSWRSADLLDRVARCCSRCLVTDTIPYVRLHWRLAWMASCPLHGEMLVPLPVAPWLVGCIRERLPERAASHLLALDRITLGAVTNGVAVLPKGGGKVPGGAWLRALRALLDELVRPIVRSSWRRRDNLAAAWLRTGRSLDARQGWTRLPYEGLLPQQRALLLQVAGTAVRHLAVCPARDGGGTALRAYTTQSS